METDNPKLLASNGKTDACNVTIGKGGIAVDVNGDGTFIYVESVIGA